MFRRIPAQKYQVVEKLPKKSVEKSIHRHNAKLRKKEFKEQIKVRSMFAQINKTKKTSKYTLKYTEDLTFPDGFPSTVGHHFVLETPDGKRASSIGYWLNKKDGQWLLDIDFVQSKPDNNRARLLLGMHPSEKIVELFIAKFAPFIRQYNAEVICFPIAHWTKGDEKWAKIYNPLRDRFFTKDGKLNLKKIRVRKLLGLAE